MTATMTTAPEVHTVFCSPAEYAMTLAKVEKINARAARKGFTGHLVLDAERTERTVTRNGFKVTEVGFNVSLTGDAPSYNGARLLAVLDIEEAGFIVRTAPGVEGIDRSNLRPGYCDHCKTERLRNRTFVVEAADGGQVQVGSTCIKDYLGWSASISFLSTEEASEEIGFGGFGGGERTYDVDSVLAIAWAATSTLGFVRTQGEGRSTRTIVSKVINGLTSFDRKDHGLVADVEAVSAKAPEATERAAEIRAWILSDEFSGASEYVQNLKVLCAGESIKDSNLGFLASAPQAHLRYLGQVEERKVEAANTINEFTGQVGDKVEINVTITGIRFIDGAYGMTTLYFLRDEAGFTYKWFSSAGSLGEEVGARFLIKGAIKGHDEYQGRKATTLTRCKVLNPNTRKPFKGGQVDHDHAMGRHQDAALAECFACWFYDSKTEEAGA